LKNRAHPIRAHDDDNVLTMKKRILLGSLAAIVLLAGGAIGWFSANKVSATQLDRLVAVSWGDGKHGPAFYGAHVYLEPAGNEFSVRARVYIGRGNNYFHDCGELGRVQTDAEAVARWSNIAWTEDGLHIGNGTNHYFLARSMFEDHR